MIGVDITSIKRFENKNELFAKKILSEQEFLQWQKSEQPALFLAQRWSIKEALFKANNDYHNFQNINIVREPSGRFSFKNFQITTSKEDDYVVAVVLEGKYE